MFRFLINNAGVELKSDFIGEQAGRKALMEMQINYIGVIHMMNHFLPVLQKQKPSYILNMLSVGSATVIKRMPPIVHPKSPHIYLLSPCALN